MHSSIKFEKLFVGIQMKIFEFCVSALFSSKKRPKYEGSQKQQKLTWITGNCDSIKSKNPIKFDIFDFFEIFRRKFAPKDATDLESLNKTSLDYVEWF